VVVVVALSVAVDVAVPMSIVDGSTSFVLLGRNWNWNWRLRWCMMNDE